MTCQVHRARGYKGVQHPSSSVAQCSRLTLPFFAPRCTPRQRTGELLPYGVQRVVRCGNEARSGRGHCKAHHPAPLYLLAASSEPLALLQGGGHSGQLARCGPAACCHRWLYWLSLQHT